MADVKVSDLPAASGLDKADILIVNQSGVTRRTTAGVLTRDIISIKDAGALVDGSTDDLSSINDAVADLVTVSGGMLYFPAGTAVVNTTSAGGINIRDNIEYCGAGWASIVKAHASSVGNVFGHAGSEYDIDIYKVSIRDLAIDGNRANVSYNTLGGGGASDDAYQNAIRLHKVHDFRIENVYIHDTVNNGISVYNTSSEGKISRCWVDAVGKATPPAVYSHNGIFVESTTTHIDVLFNTVENCGQKGIYVNAHDGTCWYTKIIGNHVTASGTNGIRVGQDVTKTSTIHRPQIIGNVVASGTSASDPAILVDTQAASGGVKSPIIASNIVYGNGHRGILVDNGSGGGTGAVDSAIVAGNEVTDNTAEGIYINGTDTLVYGNMSLSNGVANYTNTGTRTVKYGNIFNATSGGFAANGTGTNDSAAAGDIGEYQTATTGAAGMTDGVALNATSVSLTAGDWDVDGVVNYAPAATTTFGYLTQGIGITSVTIGGQGTYTTHTFEDSGGGNVIALTAPTVRISLASTTTVYLVAQAGFAVSTITASGFIRARRVR